MSHSKFSNHLQTSEHPLAMMHTCSRSNAESTARQDKLPTVGQDDVADRFFATCVEYDDIANGAILMRDGEYPTARNGAVV